MPNIRTHLPVPRDRRSQVILSRLRTGHTLATHKFLFTNSEPPRCESCNTQLTVKHIILECRLHENARKLHNLPNNMEEALTLHSASTMKLLKDIDYYYSI
nr:unnamed protein product [Callosobruchus analis]